MKYIKNRKGQGGDTFKLLIAAVVAMVILGIVTGVFQNIWALVTGITCVSSPINEMVTTIQRAQSGMDSSTDDICMSPGEAFQASALEQKVSNLASVTFKCEGAAVCDDKDPLEVTTTSISAVNSAKFKGLIHCQASTQGDYDCDITVQSASA